MFPRTDTIKTGPLTSIPSTRPMECSLDREGIG